MCYYFLRHRPVWTLTRRLEVSHHVMFSVFLFLFPVCFSSTSPACHYSVTADSQAFVICLLQLWIPLLCSRVAMAVVGRILYKRHCASHVSVSDTDGNVGVDSP